MIIRLTGQYARLTLIFVIFFLLINAYFNQSKVMKSYHLGITDMKISDRYFSLINALSGCKSIKPTIFVKHENWSQIIGSVSGAASNEL